MIAVSDWDRSNAFYRDVLGAEIEQRDEWSARYRFDGWQLNVHGPAFEGLNAADPVRPGNSDLCFVWPGPIRRSRISTRTASSSRKYRPADTTSTFAPGRHVYFRDPDGSLLEFVSYVGA